jgi:hypothetical protein
LCFFLYLFPYFKFSLIMMSTRINFLFCCAFCIWNFMFFKHSLFIFLSIEEEINLILKWRRIFFYIVWLVSNRTESANILFDDFGSAWSLVENKKVIRFIVVCEHALEKFIPDPSVSKTSITLDLILRYLIDGLLCH